MADDQAKKNWLEAANGEYLPADIFSGRQGIDRETRMAHAAEYSAYQLGQIHQKLADIAIALETIAKRSS